MCHYAGTLMSHKQEPAKDVDSTPVPWQLPVAHAQLPGNECVIKLADNEAGRMVCPAGTTSVTAIQHPQCCASIFTAVTLIGAVCSDTGCYPGCFEGLCMYTTEQQRLQKRKRTPGFGCRTTL